MTACGPEASPPELSPEFQERLFDPPCLGIPRRASLSGRAQAPGGFVAVFLAVADGRVLEAGFLTDRPLPAMLCASLWCEHVQGLSLETAAALDVLALEPGLAGLPGAVELALACREAGRAALAAAPRAPCAQGARNARQRPDGPWP